MGLISYIRKQRERKFRMKLLVHLSIYGPKPAQTIFRFVNGDDSALLEMDEYHEFQDWLRKKNGQYNPLVSKRASK